ncbi:MAG TPA: SH3-like domain-containing protein [Hyphomicrobiaceae bacterium]|nr:SH3-like domain-containing protein [Hyphomicrobiaceae bacterium]
MQTETSAPPKFKVGDAVFIDDRASLGHCRTPVFVRGKRGVVADILGAFRNPEQLAYHRPGLPAQVLYVIRFQQKDLWPDYQGPATDELDIDIYASWLKPAETR